jgi:hypothetical protein
MLAPGSAKSVQGDITADSSPEPSSASAASSVAPELAGWVEGYDFYLLSPSWSTSPDALAALLNSTLSWPDDAACLAGGLGLHRLSLIVGTQGTCAVRTTYHFG